MQLLNGKEIGVDQLYVDVWVLDRPEHKLYRSPESLLEEFDVQKDRFALGRRIGDRSSGLKVANSNLKLAILGKPGSGKTTFLKHLAVDWCSDKFQPDLIAVLIEFRRIRDDQWYLLDAIGRELELDEGHQIRVLKEQIKKLRQVVPRSLEEQQINGNQIKALQQQLSSVPLQALLTQGKLLILMDGLDEAPTEKLRRDIQEQLRVIAEEYPKNRFTLTCRTQIMTSIPMGFISVEVADFNPEQVQQFVQQWFKANGKSKAFATQQWEKIRNAVDNSPALKELTVTPVLLSLMCVVLQHVGKIPLKRDWLYEKGIKLLLSRWNEEKQIDKWEVGSKTYRQLSIKQKEKLLIAIAASKFENPKNFVLFEQDEIATQITQFLHLTNRQEGVAVLKAIEAQHGLLIERADELWSFSHLTFQEYFTVQWLTQLPFKQLAEKLENQRWQEVVKQLVKSQQPADRLLGLIKQAVDRSIASAPGINQFLTWVLQKAGSVQAPYKHAAIRSFYFALALDLARARGIDRDIDIDLAHDLNLLRVRDLDRARARDLARDLALALAYAHACDRARDLARTRARDIALALARNLEVANQSDPELKIELEKMYQKLPNSDANFHLAIQWWQTHGEQWVGQLRQVIIEHRNIGHDWQFTEAQKQQLQRYYNANKFLVDLMNIRGAVSDSVRAEIEDTLLLPWDELQRRQPHIYGQPQS